MKRSRARWVLVAFIAVLLGLAIGAVPVVAGGCKNPDTAPSQAAGTTVTIQNCGFHPIVLLATPGASIKWNHYDWLPHNVVGVGWGEMTPISPSGVVEHKFPEPGLYPYYCSLHVGMAGVVVVGDATTASEVAASSDVVGAASEPATGGVLGVALILSALLVTAGTGVLIGTRLTR